MIRGMNEESNYFTVGTKIQKEKDTVEKMIRLFCEKKHKQNKLCSKCQTLLEYSHSRLKQCQYQEDKPTCRKCPVHCYSPIMRSEIRRIMRFSGPRLVLYAPLDWIRHQLHERSS